MGKLQEWLMNRSKNKEEFKEKLKQAQEDDRIMSLIHERKKSANQRELERYQKEDEEKMVKKTLERIHKKQNSELWKGENSILSKQKSILKDDRPILKEKNIFVDNRNDIPFVKNRSMFFKW